MGAWSCDDRFLATKNDNMPNALWIWDMRTLSLFSLIIQNDPIKAARWCPKKPRLAFCCSNGNFYLWRKEGCSVVKVPSPKFVVRGLRWNPQGSCLVLADNGRFCCCFL